MSDACQHEWSIVEKGYERVWRNVTPGDKPLTFIVDVAGGSDYEEGPSVEYYAWCVRCLHEELAENVRLE